MAITSPQARMKALQLKSLKPELQSVSIDDLTARIMASEGMGTPGAGGGALADIFQIPKKLSPSSPAPMEVARLAAPKPTAQTLAGVGTGAFQRAQEIRDRKPTVTEISTANANRQALVDEARAGTGERTPVASPVAAALSTAEAPAKAKFTSRLRPQYEAAQAELEQLTAQRDALTAQGQPVDANITYGIQIKSGVASKLKAMVDAEEAAVVDAESAAVLERQTNRLTREEELVKQARKRAPGNALIAFGNALAGAKAGEKFASALTRGLVAGNESYTSAREAGEESRRTIEERRDELILKNRELIEKARADAINRANAGVAMTEGEMRLANLNQEGVNNLAMAPLQLQKLKAEAEEATVKAGSAQAVIDAALKESGARAFNYMQPPSGGSSGSDGTAGKPLSSAQATARGAAAKTDLTRLEKQILASDEAGDHAQTEQLLNQYKATRDAFNRIAVVAGRAPITVRGFPLKLPSYEAYVKKKGRHPSGRTNDQYGAYEAANKYVPS